ncbi:FAD-binding oxidoreductase [Trichloromonas sp.]|uniref:FAD-binding oxidoreductase n=1 Tax=Trichloromonas sp. TaxID=3069249 RepID=UPI003D81684C
MTSKTIIEKLNNIVGAKNCWTDPAELALYSFDSSVEKPAMPEVVVRPENTEQVAAVCKICNDHDIPLITRGAGTNLAGGTIPVTGGCVLLMTGLNRILEINTEDMYAVVQAGAITADIAAAVSAKGLFYPPDPGSQKMSTIGGNVAENAGGLRGLKYGVTKDYVMGVTFCDMAGNIVKGGGKTVKLCTGYNLTGLMCQSEGTLGVMTEFILKLVPPPKASKAMLVSFADIMEAGRTVSGIITNHVLPCTLELMDNFTIKTVHAATGADLPTDAAALLLIEVDGHPAQVEDDYQTVLKVCRENNGEVRVAETAEEKEKLWEGRRKSLSSLARLRPTLVLEDATVPRSRIPDMLLALEEIRQKHNVTIGTFGHAGDGNLHPTILCDKRDAEEMARVHQAVDAIFAAALAMDGTCSGEHGIGIAKVKYMVDEVGEGTINYMKQLKKGVDPKNLLNPTKMGL